ncbi:MAG: hypothetical protein AUH72_03745 [Acidobacteria bacterium 13_1_40CM_4_65_8]|nr:MAG: hypothetical protein AUH72_03745 [Acidobacteria bacterium 13_1_40CM_4_65_8]
MQQHQLARMADGEIAEHERVQQAEERRVRADRQRQRQEGDSGEGRCLTEPAERVACVVQHNHPPDCDLK